MTKEQKDLIIKILAGDRSKFAIDCNKRIAEECGKMAGADYMFQRLLDAIREEDDKSEGCELVDLGNGMFKECYKTESEVKE